MTNIWANSILLDKLSMLREEARVKGERLAFDCLNLKCCGNRAVCSKGHNPGTASDGSLPLYSVLKGISPRVCKECKDFTG